MQDRLIVTALSLLCVFSAAAADELGPHVDDYGHVICVLEGHGELKVGGRRTPASPGTIMVTEAGEPHGIVVRGADHRRHTEQLERVVDGLPVIGGVLGGGMTGGLPGLDGLPVVGGMLGGGLSGGLPGLDGIPVVGGVVTGALSGSLPGLGGLPEIGKLR